MLLRPEEAVHTVGLNEDPDDVPPIRLEISAFDDNSFSDLPMIPFTAPGLISENSPTLMRHETMTVITAEPGPAVDRTVNIQGQLPNAIFTLIPSTIVTCLKAAHVPEEAYFICRKFLKVLYDFDSTGKTIHMDGTVVTLHSGRIFTSGNNILGQCGIAPREHQEPGRRDTLTDFTDFPLSGPSSVGDLDVDGAPRSPMARYPPYNAGGRGGHAGATMIDMVSEASGDLSIGGDLDDVSIGSWSEGDDGVLTTDITWVDTPHWVRLPPVLRVWYGSGAMFAKTTLGVFAWGDGEDGRLGINRPGPSRYPCPVVGLLGQAVRYVLTFQTSTFFQLESNEWYAAGANFSGELGLGYRDDAVTIPAPVLNSLELEISHICSNFNSTFAWTPTGLHACGSGFHGQLGVGGVTPQDHIRLTRVRLPPATDVHRVVTNRGATFIFTLPRAVPPVNRGHSPHNSCPDELEYTPQRGYNCYVCGNNMCRQLGMAAPSPIPSSSPRNHEAPVGDGLVLGMPPPHPLLDDCVYTPTRLPFSVSDVASDGHTVFLSDGQLLHCGNNHSLALPAPEEAKQVIRVDRYDGQTHLEEIVTQPTPLSLPAEARRISICNSNLFIELYNRSVLARGRNWRGSLGVDFDGDMVSTWQRVTLPGPVTAVWGVIGGTPAYLCDDGIYSSGPELCFQTDGEGGGGLGVPRRLVGLNPSNVVRVQTIEMDREVSVGL